MSLLLSKRPSVKFDPTNRDHRRWLGEFITTHSWRNCPVQLTVPGYGNTVATMQELLLLYYTKQEFDSKD